MAIRAHGRRFVKRLGADRWLGVGWPQEFGGQGRSATEQWLFQEEMYRRKLPAGLLTLTSVGPCLIRAGSDVQKAEMLPRILAGEIDVAIGYTEPDAGTDLGDAHVGNTYRTGDGIAGWGDWQVCLRGHWGYDVTYALTTALAIDDRRAWERDLIAYYVGELARAGGPAHDPEVAWGCIAGASSTRTSPGRVTLGRSAIQPKMQPPEYCLPVIQRTSQAIVDLDPVAALRVS